MGKTRKSASDCTRGGLDWIEGIISSQKGWPGTETGSLRKWLSPSLEVFNRLGDVVLGDTASC